MDLALSKLLWDYPLQHVLFWQTSLLVQGKGLFISFSAADLLATALRLHCLLFFADKRLNFVILGALGG